MPYFLNIFVRTVYSEQGMAAFSVHLHPGFLIVLNLPCRLNSSGFMWQCGKKYMIRFYYQDNSSTIHVQPSFLPRQVNILVTRFTNLFHDKSVQCSGLDVHLCLSVRSCALGVMPLCLDSHVLGSSYLRRWDSEESCWLDFINAAIQNADSWIFHLHKVSCKLSCVLCHMPNDHNDLPLEALKHRGVRALAELSLCCEGCAEGDVDAASNVTSKKVLTVPDVHHQELWFTGLGFLGGGFEVARHCEFTQINQVLC